MLNMYNTDSICTFVLPVAMQDEVRRFHLVLLVQGTHLNPTLNRLQEAQMDMLMLAHRTADSLLRRMMLVSTIGSAIAVQTEQDPKEQICPMAHLQEAMVLRVAFQVHG